MHQRNDDADFQVLDGRKVCPIHHELLSLGRPAGEAAAVVTRSELDPADADKPVVLVGGSFIGEQSADVSEIGELDPAVHHEVVRLWAPPLWSEEEQDAMVAVRGADILLRLLGYRAHREGRCRSATGGGGVHVDAGGLSRAVRDRAGPYGTERRPGIIGGGPGRAAGRIPGCRRCCTPSP